MKPLRDADLLTQVANIVLAALLLRQLVLFFQVIPNSLYDFNIFRNAGYAVLHGHSPYSIDGYIYPATAAVAFVPFAAIPFGIGGAIFGVLTVVALGFALWILEIRDWRCYAVVLVSMPGWTSVTTGTLSGVCTLLAAMVYRYRDSRWPCAAALAAALATKVFLWPLGLWLAATRRTRTAVLAAASTLGALLLSWLVIGTSNFAGYHDSMRDAKQLAEASYSPFALLRALELSPVLAILLVGAAGLTLVGTAWFVKNEAQTFCLAVCAALVMSPVIWIHYLVLLYVPIAIARPRLSPLWFLPLVFVPAWLPPHANGSAARIGLVLALVAATFFFAVRDKESGLGRRALTRGARGIWPFRAVPSRQPSH